MKYLILLSIAVACLGCGAGDDPQADVPAAAKNEQPLPGSDQQMSEASARARAMGEEMNRQKPSGN